MTAGIELVIGLSMRGQRRRELTIPSRVTTMRWRDSSSNFEERNEGNEICPRRRLDSNLKFRGAALNCPGAQVDLMPERCRSQRNKSPQVSDRQIFRFYAPVVSIAKTPLSASNLS